MPEYYARVGPVKEKCAGTGVGAEYHYCREGWMYGISAAEFRRRENSTAEICGDPPNLPGAARMRRPECVGAVMRGERYKPAPAAMQVTAEQTAEQKRKQFLAEAWAKVEAVHPGWREIGRTPEFQAWKASSPVYEKLAASEDVNDAIALFNLYKAYQNRANVSPPATKPIPARVAATVATSALATDTGTVTLACPAYTSSGVLSDTYVWAVDFDQKKVNGLLATINAERVRWNFAAHEFVIDRRSGELHAKGANGVVFYVGRCAKHVSNVF
jgi:hypothetical protein